MVLPWFRAGAAKPHGGLNCIGLAALEKLNGKIICIDIEVYSKDGAERKQNSHYRRKPRAGNQGLLLKLHKNRKIELAKL